MSDDTYQGWTNRETWMINLWLNNDYGPYKACCDIASEIGLGRDEPDVIAVGEAIEAMLDAWLDNEQAPQFGLWADLINAAMGRVNWPEIGLAFCESVR